MKPKTKKMLAVAAALAVALLITGCSRHGSAYQAPTSGPYYWIYVLFGRPIQNIMLAVKNAISGPNGAGWAITIITFVVRLILMPFMLGSQKKAVRQQEKVARLQPQIKRVQAAMQKPGLTQMQQSQLGQLQMQVYRENNISMTGGMGCLPLIIQLPIMIGIYQAVAYSKELAATSFFGISLGQRSLILTIVATVLYLIQGYISLIGIPEEQKKAMQATVLLSPAMTFFISLSAPGALALYFLIGGIIAIIQQLITTFLLKPTVKKEIEQELKDEPFKEVASEAAVNEIVAGPTAETKQAEQDLHEDLRKRNQQAKQQRDHDDHQQEK
ncbi:MAG: membrane protein insertase YidC [Lactobacillus sp.]|jgi:YidC/Oxa1 family membrane protein insertase|nr:membrane protein insertase YidC [Lactobacillus sp.]